MYATKNIIKERRPLIHHITNQVSMAFQANACSALGASPIMASALEEVGEITRQADGLLLNMGTPQDLAYPAYFQALKEHSTKTIVLDPVGIGVSVQRLKACIDLLETGKIAILKGNAGEIAALSGERGHSHGVDAKIGITVERLKEMAAFVSREYQTVVVLTGETDLVVDAAKGKQALIKGGHPWLSQVSGSGCVLGTVLSVFLSMDAEHPYKQAVEAVRFYQDSAQRAAARSSHFGEFPQLLMTMLRSVDDE